MLNFFLLSLLIKRIQWNPLNVATSVRGQIDHVKRPATLNRSLFNINRGSVPGNLGHVKRWPRLTGGYVKRVTLYIY